MFYFQVVAFQAAMSIMAEQFPGAFSGYKLQVLRVSIPSSSELCFTLNFYIENLNVRFSKCFFETRWGLSLYVY